MADVTRTFLAVTVPGAIAPRLERLQARLEHDTRQGHWSAPRPWHLTLAFLGDVPHADLLSVCRAAEEVAAAHPRFALKLQGVGAFPDPAHPRVVWAGVAGPGLDALGTIQAALAQALASLGYPGDHRAFHPHVTLGRLKPRRGSSLDMTGILSQFTSWSTGPFPVEEVVTFSSTLTPSGPEYAPLGRGRLARKIQGQ
jgi:2'-5' RNA ligase